MDLLKIPGVAFRKLVRELKGEGRNARVLVENQIGQKPRRQLIPPQVFQTAETALVHPRHGRSIENFRALNKDLHFLLFSRDQRDAYMAEKWGDHPISEIYRRAKFGQMQADIFRYCIVFDKGGYWVDFNKGFDCSITSLHSPNSEGVISSETVPSFIFPRAAAAKHLKDPVTFIVQWAFGFSKAHPILQMVIDRLVDIEPFFRDRKFDSPKNALLTMSATGLFTSVVRDFSEINGLRKVEQLGTDFFGHGIFRLDGWGLSIDRQSHYARRTSEELFSSASE